MASNRVNAHREEVRQLKTQFQRLNQETVMMNKNLEGTLTNVSNKAKE